MHERSVVFQWTSGAFLAFVLFLVVPGCQTATEPYTGRRQLILTPRSTELQMGERAWREILSKEKPCTDPKKIAAVQRVGKALAAVVPNSGFHWQFKVFQSDQANAFCLPGGKVGVYSGLFKYVDNDAELAAVLGHEIGHAIAHHGAERMTQGMLVDLGALGLSMALDHRGSEHTARWLRAYSGLATLGYLLPYDRTQEYSADQIGLMLMAKAGYDPEAALAFWRRFAAGHPRQPAIAEFLATHPLDQKRIARLRRELYKANLEYELAPVRRGLGKVYRDRPDDF